MTTERKTTKAPAASPAIPISFHDCPISDDLSWEGTELDPLSANYRRPAAGGPRREIKVKKMRLR